VSDSTRAVSALLGIDPGCPRDQWIKVGMAAKCLVSDVPRRSRSRNKPLTLPLDHHRAAIQCLLQGPSPLAQVARRIGTDEQKLVGELRELGLDVQTVAIPCPGDDVMPDVVTVCYLTKRDTRKVTHFIKTQERKNDLL